MKPTELYVFDFDETLYRSRKPPLPSPAWWYHASTLDGHGAPGFDSRWILKVVAVARAAQQAPWARTALLTGRPKHSAMDRKIREVLSGARLRFDHFHLKPVIPVDRRTRDYKAAVVTKLLLAHPSIQRVVFYDDRPENLEAVGEAAEGGGVAYVPVLTP